MRVISFPFRVVGGHVASVDQGSLENHVELVAALVSTRKGERPLVPDFGITDPVFAEVDAAEIRAGLRMFGPDVELLLNERVLSGERVAYDVEISERKA